MIPSPCFTIGAVFSVWWYVLGVCHILCFGPNLLIQTRGILSPCLLSLQHVFCQSPWRILYDSPLFHKALLGFFFRLMSSSTGHWLFMVALLSTESLLYHIFFIFWTMELIVLHSLFKVWHVFLKSNNDIFSRNILYPGYVLITFVSP